MANPAAQTYFNSFDPATQAQIRASWAGNPNGMDDWFNAAQGAGAVGPTGERKGGGGDQGAGVNTGAGSGGMTPQKLRQHARQQGWSEDFARFDDALLEGWISRSWDPAKGKFRSEHAPQGASGDWAYVEKPTEGIVDPQGIEWGPHGTKSGVNLSALGLNSLGGSVRTGDAGLPPGQRGGITPQGVAPQQPASFSQGLFDPSNPLQNHLIGMVQQGALGFGGNNAASLEGGGVWSGTGADFSQAFNPLAPQGQQKKRGGRGGAQPQNPFAPVAAPAAQAAVQPFAAATGAATAQPVQQKPMTASPMQNKLYKLYGGNNTF